MLSLRRTLVQRVHVASCTLNSLSSASSQVTATTARCFSSASSTPSSAPTAKDPSSSSSSSSSSPPPLRSRPLERSASAGAPPTSSHFFRFGAPFLLFLLVGTYGYASLLQPGYEQQSNNQARERLYGRSTRDTSGTTDKQKSSTTAAASASKSDTAASPPPPARRLRTLEEEYERSQKEFQSEFELKPVPRPANPIRTR